MSTRPESFLQNGPSQLLLDFYSALPDHQINIHQESIALSCFKVEVDNAVAVLKAQMVNVCSNSALMLNFMPSVQGVTYIDLTQEEDTLKMPPFKGNITSAQKDDANCSNIIPDNTSSVREEPWTCAAHSAPTGSGLVAPQLLTSALQSVFSDVEKSPFTPGCLNKVKKLVSKENTHSTLLSI